MKNKLIKKIVSMLTKNGAKKITLFGSYARGEEKKGSDVDIIVEFRGRKSLLDIVGIEQEVSKNTGVKIDLLTPKSLSPYISKKILGESKVLYA